MSRIMWLVVPFVSLMFAVAYITGLLVFAYYYQEQCDPLKSGQISSPNEVVYNGLQIYVDTFTKHLLHSYQSVRRKHGKYYSLLLVYLKITYLS